MNYPRLRISGSQILRILKTCNNLNRRAARGLRISSTTSSKVPKEPTWKPVDPKDLPQETPITAPLVAHLERLALVDFNNQAGIDRLRAVVRFADQLHLVDTTGVEPMDSVLEGRELYLRQDEVTEGRCRDDLLKNAAVTEEEYFVAPPGNIPLKQTDKPQTEEGS